MTSADARRPAELATAWLPNALTLLRVGLIPAVLFHAHWCRAEVEAGEEGASHRLVAVLALVGIGASDVLDGWLARRIGSASRLGAVLDAAADKLVQFFLLGFYHLSGGSAFHPVPLGFLLVIVGWDLVLALGVLAVRLRRGRVEVVHRLHGKLASLCLFLLLLWITIDLPRAVVDPALWGVAVLATISGLEYVRDGWRQWNAAGATPGA